MEAQGASALPQLLSDLAGERIIILSTHIVSDVEATASEIVIINKGCQVQRATPDQLLALLDGRVWQRVVPEEQLTGLKQTYLVLFMMLLSATILPATMGMPGFADYPYIDVFGWQFISDRVTRSSLAAYPDAGGLGFGAIELAGGPAIFTYNGIHWTTGILASRSMHLLLAVGLVLLAIAHAGKAPAVAGA